jgi:Domain of unknown function (DUF4145)
VNCPYCGITFSLDGVNGDLCFPKFERFNPGSLYAPVGFVASKQPLSAKKEENYQIVSHKCPECRNKIMWLQVVSLEPKTDSKTIQTTVVNTTLLFPKRAVKNLPKEVLEKFAVDFREAYDTLEISPKASAALSRRCLQNLIREQEGIIEHDLIEEIKELLNRNKLPQDIADDLDSIRNVGNFAAHPVKNTNTGQIEDVEIGEAEWTLQILEELLLFYFCQQAISKARRDKLNKKLKDAGRKPML